MTLLFYTIIRNGQTTIQSSGQWQDGSRNPFLYLPGISMRKPKTVQDWWSPESSKPFWGREG